MTSVSAKLKDRIEIEDIISIRKLVSDDPIALQKWGVVKDQLVYEPTQRLKVRNELHNCEFEEAIKHTLEVWRSTSVDHATYKNLASIFKQNGLVALAENLLSSVQIRSESPIWFEVGDLINNFEGRTEELDKLHSLVLKSLQNSYSSLSLLVLVSGLGGVGKTTLVRRYAYQNHAYFDKNVIWIYADSITAMRNSFTRLAKIIGLDFEDQISNSALVSKVYQKLSLQKSLFIFDNVETFTDLDQFRPKGLSPDCVKPCVLLTSRNRDILVSQSQVFRLDVLTLKEATDFIKKHVEDAKEEDAMRLAKEVQCLPLALQQAVAYINDRLIINQFAIPKYLKQFHTSSALLNDQRFMQLNGYEQTTLTTWTITMNRIAEDVQYGEFAINLIGILAYLNPDAISLDLLNEIFGDNTEICLKLLQRFSMLTVNNVLVNIHRLVQLVVRLGLDGESELKCLKSILDIFSNVLQGRNVMNVFAKECASHSLYLFEFQCKYDSLFEVYADYLDDLCSCLRIFAYGSFAECHSIATKCTERYQALFGETNINTLRMRLNMALAYTAEGNRTDSLRILSEICPIAENVLGVQSSITRAMLMNLADCLLDGKEYQKSIEILDRIISIGINNFGLEDKTTLTATFFKAKALYKFGDLTQALCLYEQLIPKWLELGGPNHPNVLSTRSRVAQILYKQTELDRALEIYKDVYERRKSVLGPKHSNTLYNEEQIKLIENEIKNRNLCSKQLN